MYACTQYVYACVPWFGSRFVAVDVYTVTVHRVLLFLLANVYIGHTARLPAAVSPAVAVGARARDATPTRARAPRRRRHDGGTDRGPATAPGRGDARCPRTPTPRPCPCLSPVSVLCRLVCVTAVSCVSAADAVMCDL